MPPETITMTCSYGASDYEVSVDIKKSQYYKLLPTVMSVFFLPYYSTIDDICVNEIAKQLNEQLEGRRDRVKASVLLSLIQTNIEYVSDEERFGKDVWEIPAYTISEGVADCDGMANLYTSIAHNMGLDVVSVIVTGHMCSAVNIPGLHGKKYLFDNKEFFHIETTDSMPTIGRFWDSDVKTLYIEYPEIPTEDFKKILNKY